MIVIVALIATEIASAKVHHETKIEMEKFMKDMYAANSLNDLMKYGIKPNFKQGFQIKKAPLLGRGSYRSGPVAMVQQQSVAIDATPGKCDPKPVCIANPLTLDIKSTQYAFPPCINIHRCDGCCHTNEECVAIGTHEVELQKVGIITFDPASENTFDETSVTVLNHTDCECQCQWKNDQDCQKINSNLVKNPHACECSCPEEVHCDAYHQFDRESCKCKCKERYYSRLQQSCEFKGFDWNEEICKCEAVRKVRNLYSRSVRMINRG